MDILFQAQLIEKSADQKLGADTAEEIRALFALATNALMAADAVLKEQKEKLGRGFKQWVQDNEMLTADSTKLIKLFDSFGACSDDLTEVNPLSLFRLLGSSSLESKECFLQLAAEYKEAGEKVKDSDVAAIKKAHDIKRVDKGAKLIGNQVGGTAVLRLEVKEHELANELDGAFKESNFASVGSWLDFLNESARTVQEISQLVLGRRIESKEELFDLMSAVVPQEAPSFRPELVPSLQLAPVSKKELVPLTQVLPSLPSCAGLKAVVSDGIKNISSALQDVYESVRGRSCEILRAAYFDEFRIIANFGFEDFSAVPIPQEWLLVEA